LRGLRGGDSATKNFSGRARGGSEGGTGGGERLILPGRAQEVRYLFLWGDGGGAGKGRAEEKTGGGRGGRA